MDGFSAVDVRGKAADKHETRCRTGWLQLQHSSARKDCSAAQNLIDEVGLSSFAQDEYCVLLKGFQNTEAPEEMGNQEAEEDRTGRRSMRLPNRGSQLEVADKHDLLVHRLQ